MIPGISKAFAAGICLLAFLATPTMAQQSGTIRATHGAWSIICDTPAGAPPSNA